jgi:hypothetical protein
MSNYDDRIAHKLLMLSANSNDIEEAVLEWEWQGECESGHFECELCGKKNLLDRFKLINVVKEGDVYLWVGSDCVKNYLKLSKEDVKKLDLKSKELRLNRKVQKQLEMIAEAAQLSPWVAKARESFEDFAKNSGFGLSPKMKNVVERVLYETRREESDD